MTGQVLELIQSRVVGLEERLDIALRRIDSLEASQVTLKIDVDKQTLANGLRNTRRNRRWMAIVKRLDAAGLTDQIEQETVAWALVRLWEDTP